MSVADTRTKLNEAREQYLWAKFALRRCEKGSFLKGVWLTRCHLAKQRLRHCCNELHALLNWEDVDGTKLKA